MPNNSKKQIIFTFDYELFLGQRSGTVADCILAPTEKIMEIFSPYDYRLIFFVDTIYLLRLKEQAASSKKCGKDYEAIIAQLCKLVQHKHYIFPHLHPHWLDAVYVSTSNEWTLSDTSKYRYHNLAGEMQGLVFDESMVLLQNILKAARSTQQIDTYRAGGWCIQPFNDFVMHFRKHRIVNDMSVLKNRYGFSDVHYFDFTICPDKVVYHFEDDVCEEIPTGSFREYTISQVQTSLQQRRLVKLQQLLANKLGLKKAKGSVVLSHPSNTTPRKSVNTIDFTAASMETLVYFYYSNYRRLIEQNDYVHFISHPKLLTCENFYYTKKLLRHIEHNFSCEPDFRNMIFS